MDAAENACMMQKRSCVLGRHFLLDSAAVTGKSSLGNRSQRPSSLGDFFPFGSKTRDKETCRWIGESVRWPVLGLA